MRRPVKFMDLQPQDCRYVVKGEIPKDFRFCAKEKVRGSSYCSFHANVCSNGKPDRSYYMHKSSDNEREAA